MVEAAGGHADLDRAIDLSRDLAIGRPVVDRGGNRVRITVADGLASLAEIARRVEVAGLPVAELCLRRRKPDDASSSPTGPPGRPIRRTRSRPGGTPA